MDDCVCVSKAWEDQNVLILSKSLKEICREKIWKCLNILND